MDATSPALARALETKQVNKAVGQLMGIVTGIVSDGELTDKETLFLRTWLTEHDAVAETWPGSAIHRLVTEVLFDGVITPEERTHLLSNLAELVRTDFVHTGSALADGPTLPVNDTVTIDLPEAAVCHTGVFLFGTRAAVERATERAGGQPCENITRKTDVLVIGSRVSPNWLHTTYGRKIMAAKALQDEGTGIEIISEQRWLKALAP